MDENYMHKNNGRRGRKTVWSGEQKSAEPIISELSSCMIAHQLQLP